MNWYKKSQQNNTEIIPINKNKNLTNNITKKELPIILMNLLMN